MKYEFIINRHIFFIIKSKSIIVLLILISLKIMKCKTLDAVYKAQQSNKPQYKYIIIV